MLPDMKSLAVSWFCLLWRQKFKLTQKVIGSWPVSAFGLSQQAADPADQSLDKSIARADLAVQALHLQQLPLQGLPKSCSHVAFQLQSHRQEKEINSRLKEKPDENLHLKNAYGLGRGLMHG